jgi:hypothetical protein
MLLSPARHIAHPLSRRLGSIVAIRKPVHATARSHYYYHSSPIIPMCADAKAGEPTAVSLPNSEQFYLDSEQGRKYLIQVSWPLHWQDVDTTDRSSVPIM